MSARVRPPSSTRSPRRRVARELVERGDAAAAADQRRRPAGAAKPFPSGPSTRELTRRRGARASSRVPRPTTLKRNSSCRSHRPVHRHRSRQERIAMPALGIEPEHGELTGPMAGPAGHLEHEPRGPGFAHARDRAITARPRARARPRRRGSSARARARLAEAERRVERARGGVRAAHLEETRRTPSARSSREERLGEPAAESEPLSAGRFATRASGSPPRRRCASRARSRRRRPGLPPPARARRRTRARPRTPRPTTPRAAALASAELEPSPERARSLARSLRAPRPTSRGRVPAAASLGRPSLA